MVTQSSKQFKSIKKNNQKNQAAIKTVYKCDDIQIQQGNFSTNDILKIINKSLKIDTLNDSSNDDENNKKINKNTFVELNIENSEDYILETDIQIL